ncbi:MAG: hypothetical protein Q7V63_07810 [Gammaproteobacteria bacterium]|nr:hypothetical protein [Gammaproteobacteria bacterium]
MQQATSDDSIVAVNDEIEPLLGDSVAKSSSSDMQHLNLSNAIQSTYFGTVSTISSAVSSSLPGAIVGTALGAISGAINSSLDSSGTSIAAGTAGTVIIYAAVCACLYPLGLATRLNRIDTDLSVTARLALFAGLNMAGSALGATMFHEHVEVSASSAAANIATSAITFASLSLFRYGIGMLCQSRTNTEYAP